MATRYLKFSAIRRAAWKDRLRALPPSEAICFRCSADNRAARAHPPRRPNARAASVAFMAVLCLALSILANLLTDVTSALSSFRLPGVLQVHDATSFGSNVSGRPAARCRDRVVRRREEQSWTRPNAATASPAQPGPDSDGGDDRGPGFGPSGHLGAVHRDGATERRNGKGPTSTRWSSSLPQVLSINTNTGVASTPSTPFDFLLGETTLNVEVSLAGAVLTDQARGSREILVLPDGTFRVVGAVTEADSPGQAVRDAILEVRLTEGLSSLPVARASTDATGRYRLYGVPAESYLHVRRPGYVSVTERTHVGSHTTRDSASQQT